jgi:hypothetical protein
MLQTLSTFVDAGKVGGWVRAGVAAGLTIAIAKFPGLSSFIDPATQTAIAVAVSGITVGIWSHYVKS